MHYSYLMSSISVGQWNRPQYHFPTTDKLQKIRCSLDRYMKIQNIFNNILEKKVIHIYLVLEYDQIFSGKECVFYTGFVIKRHQTVCSKCSIALKCILSVYKVYIVY